MPAQPNPDAQPPLQPAPFWRRLAAMVYDSLLIIALWFVATALLLPLFAGQAVPQTGAAHYLYQLYLLAVALLFFGWFWTHGGQTAGMKAWKIRLLRHDGAPAGWREAVLRFFAALLAWLPLGLGIWWALWDRDGYGWHDRLSGTRLIMKT